MAVQLEVRMQGIRPSCKPFRRTVDNETYAEADVVELLRFGIQRRRCRGADIVSVLRCVMVRAFWYNRVKRRMLQRYTLGLRI